MSRSDIIRRSKIEYVYDASGPTSRAFTIAVNGLPAVVVDVARGADDTPAPVAAYLDAVYDLTEWARARKEKA